MTAATNAPMSATVICLRNQSCNQLADVENRHGAAGVVGKRYRGVDAEHMINGRQRGATWLVVWAILIAHYHLASALDWGASGRRLKSYRPVKRVVALPCGEPVSL